MLKAERVAWHWPEDEGDRQATVSAEGSPMLRPWLVDSDSRGQLAGESKLTNQPTINMPEADFMHICVHTDTRAEAHTHAHTHIHTHIHTHVSIGTDMRVYTHRHLLAYTHVHRHRNAHMCCTHIFSHTHIHRWKHRHAQVYTHIFTYTCTCMLAHTCAGTIPLLQTPQGFLSVASLLPLGWLL